MFTRNQLCDRRSVFCILMLLIVALTRPLGAATTEQISPTHERAIREYLRLVWSGGALDAGVAQATEVAARAVEPTMEGNLGRPLTDDERGKLHTVIKRMFGEIFTEPAFEQELMPVVAKQLAEDEVNEALRFYRTPLGSKLIRIAPVLMAEATAAGERLVKANGQVLDRFEEQFEKEFPGLLRARSTTNWEPFSRKGGGFTVLMPGAPKEEEHTVNSAGGPVVFHIFSSEVKHPSVVYMTSYADYPDSLVHERSADDLLDGARDGAVANTGTLLNERIITLAGYPGRQLTIEVAGGGVYQSRIYLVRRRIYQVAAVTSKEQRFSSNVTKFLDSFRLLKK